MKKKQYKLRPEDLQPLVEGAGACMATDAITVHGARVGFLYREEAEFEDDSGWRFFAGDEPEGYIDDPDNVALYDVNTIANYDPSIIPLLDAPAGSAYERKPGDAEFVAVDLDDEP